MRRSENIWVDLQTLNELLLPSVCSWEPLFKVEPVIPENTDFVLSHQVVAECGSTFLHQQRVASAVTLRLWQKDISHPVTLTVFVHWRAPFSHSQHGWWHTVISAITQCLNLHIKVVYFVQPAVKNQKVSSNNYRRVRKQVIFIF